MLKREFSVGKAHKRIRVDLVSKMTPLQNYMILTACEEKRAYIQILIHKTRLQGLLTFRQHHS